MFNFNLPKSISVFFIFSLIQIFIFSWVQGEVKEQYPVIKTKTHSVALFKNGLGFFVKSGEVNPQNGWEVVEDVPHASLGSLWLGSLEGDYPVDDVIGYKEDSLTETPAVSLDELLKGNIGKDIGIVYSGTTISGILKDVPEDREQKTDGVTSPYDYRYPANINPLAASVVLLDSQGSIVALNKNLIQQVWFPKGYLSTFLMKEKTRKLKLKLNARKKAGQISLSYLQKGISWIPSYLVDINDSGKARISLKAEVINDAEDVENAEFYFVVGFPNFKYADILSPMSMDQTLTQFISALNNPNQPNYGANFSNVMQQSLNYSYAGEMSSPSGVGYSSMVNLQGTAEEDLFLYQKKEVSLKKGERAYYPVFSDTVNYQHIYEWNISDTLQEETPRYNSSVRENPEKDQIWHSIKLTNSTNYPWTTAPAFTVNGTKPLAQDELAYTPKGAKINLKLTVATDIKSDHKEVEIDRQRNISIYGRNYDLVTIQGELYLKNYKTKEAEVEIKKKVTGDVLDVINDAKVTTVAEGLKSVNKNSKINWDITLSPSQETTLLYKYKTYIAR